MLAQCRQCLQTFLQPQTRIMRRHGHADLLTTHRSGVTLTPTAPVHLHVIGPGRNAKMPAEGIAEARPRTAIKPSPAPDTRVRPVRTHDPASAHYAVPEMNSVPRNASDRCS